MSERKKLNKGITAREEAIAAEREQEAVILANLGQSVYDADSEVFKDSGVFTKNISGIGDEIRNLEDFLRRLLADDEKRNAFQEELKSLKVELRNIRNKEEPLFEELGKSAWELWKSGRSLHENMESALDDLIKADARLHAVEDAVLRTEQEVENKAVKLLTKGKAILLAGRKKTAASALDRLWNRAGEKLSRTVPSESFSDTPAAVPSATLEALGKRREEISERVEVLNNETAALDAALEEMPGKGGVKKRVSWIEDSLENKHNELDVAFRNLGEAWLTQSKGKISDPNVAKWKKEWSEADRRISVLQEEQKSLSAHLALLDLEEVRGHKAGQVSEQEKEVKSRQAVLKGLKKELAVLDKELAAQKEQLPPLPEKS